MRDPETTGTLAACREHGIAFVAYSPLGGQDILPIPGTKRVTYLEENAAAMGVTLSGSEIAEIDAVFPPDSAVGDRYQTNMMGSINA